MMTSTNNPSKDQSVSLAKRLNVPCSFYVLSPISLIITFLCLYAYNLSITPSPQTQLTPQSNSIATCSSPSPHSPPLSPPCDYSDGKWVRDKRGPLYNSRTCEIKATHNCIANGRPDSEYLYWRWKPSGQCHLPRFEPYIFLQLVKDKHVAFVGDSVAHNQFDSLICMLLTASTPNRIDSYQWHFSSHNASLFFYWSPFLVEGVQKVSHMGPNYYNTVHLDRVNEKWAMEVDKMDLIMLSIGHWLSEVPSVYYEGGSVLGCINCPNLNCTNIDFYGPLRKALRVALNTIIKRKANKGNGIDVVVRTYSPSHFEGSWDKGGTCLGTRPRRKGKKSKLEGMSADIRRIQMEEVENAKEKTKQFGRFRFEAMDVTKLALLRPDGHPGPYMNALPFAKGVPEHVQNDCLHWCLPAPIDTWNEIFVEMMKRWMVRLRSEQ